MPVLTSRRPVVLVPHPTLRQSQPPLPQKVQYMCPEIFSLAPLCQRVCSSVFHGSVVLSQALFSSWRSQKSTAARNEEFARNIFQIILVSNIHRTA